MVGEHITKRSERMHHEGHKHTNTEHPNRCDLASVWAARTLISPTALVHAAKDRTLIIDVARELSVTPHDLETYLGALPPPDYQIMYSLVGHALV